MTRQGTCRGNWAVCLCVMLASHSPALDYLQNPVDGDIRPPMPDIACTGQRAVTDQIVAKFYDNTGALIQEVAGAGAGGTWSGTLDAPANGWTVADDNHIKVYKTVGGVTTLMDTHVVHIRTPSGGGGGV